MAEAKNITGSCNDSIRDTPGFSFNNYIPPSVSTSRRSSGVYIRSPPYTGHDTGSTMSGYYSEYSPGNHYLSPEKIQSVSYDVRRGRIPFSPQAIRWGVLKEDWYTLKTRYRESSLTKESSDVRPDDLAPDMLRGQFGQSMPESTTFPNPSRGAMELGHDRTAIEPNKRALFGYLIGQLSNIVKMGLWWSLFGSLILTLFKGDPIGIGAARCAFNAALLLLSPIVGPLLERWSARHALQVTVLLRALVYSLLLPLCWILWQSDLILRPSNDVAFYTWLIGLLFVDGIVVAIGKSLDIDSQGTDMISKQHCNGQLSAETRQRFLVLHTRYFDASVILITPILTLAAKFAFEECDTSLSKIWTAWKNSDGQTKHGAVLVILFSVSFFIFSAISTCSYLRLSGSSSKSGLNSPLLMPSSHRQSKIGSSSSSSVASFPSSFAQFQPSYLRPEPSFCEEVKMMICALPLGLRLYWADPSLRFPILSWILEESISDAVVSLIVTEYAFVAMFKGPTNYLTAALYASSFVAIGKFAAIVSNIVLARNWVQCHLRSRLYIYIFLGSFSSLGIPASLWFQDYSRLLSLLIFCISLFLFFLFWSCPRVGWNVLFRLNEENPQNGKVQIILGFLAFAGYLSDSIILMLMALVFHFLDIQIALWCTCGTIALYGVIQVIMGFTQYSNMPPDN